MKVKTHSRISYIYCIGALFLNDILGCGVQLGPLGTAATNRPVVPAPSDYDDGTIGGILAKENISTRRKPQTPREPGPPRCEASD
jgi:hypothetical protein